MNEQHDLRTGTTFFLKINFFSSDGIIILINPGIEILNANI